MKGATDIKQNKLSEFSFFHLTIELEEYNRCLLG